MMDQPEVTLSQSYSFDSTLLALADKLGVTVKSQVDPATEACISKLTTGKKTLPVTILKAACVGPSANLPYDCLAALYSQLLQASTLRPCQSWVPISFSGGGMQI